jgi:hypothetical protein
VDSIRTKYRTSRRKLTCLGTLLTLIVIAVDSGLVWYYGAGDLKLNTVGDFLAGAVAPLAFIWLIIGYLQQNLELSLNTDTLISQLDEMRLSVEQQTRQASSLAQNEGHARRDTLLKLSELYLNRLSGSASVIGFSVLPLNADVLDNAWRFYSSGDRDYFFRLLMTGMINEDQFKQVLSHAIANRPDVR